MTASLFIGRWQPFHQGHKALIESALRDGRDVVVAIRDTPPGPENPYTVEERQDMIFAALSAWMGHVEIIVMPDIAEVCYGRTPGYGIREIRLSEDVEAVSGTSIRAGR